MRTPVLIFDFGNVVAHFDYLRACERFVEGLALTGPALMDRLRERGFDALLAEFECGRVSAEEFVPRTMKLADLEISHEDFVIGWQDIFWLNKPVARLLAHLKERGYTLLLGSNTNVLHATHFRRQFDMTLELFDHLVLSYEIGHMKPSPEFYAACVAASNAPAGSCVFIDDRLENVEAARQAGMTAIHFTDEPPLVAALEELGVEVANEEDENRANWIATLQLEDMGVEVADEEE